MFKNHLDASGNWCRMQVYIYDVKYTDLILSKCGNLNLYNSEWFHLFYEILCFLYSIIIDVTFLPNSYVIIEIRWQALKKLQYLYGRTLNATLF